MLELIAKNREQLKYIIVDVTGINQIDASGEEVLSSLVELCSISGIEILFARAEGIEAILQRSGFIRKFGEGRFFNRRAEALRFAWQEIEGESEEVEVSPETL